MQATWDANQQQGQRYPKLSEAEMLQLAEQYGGATVASTRLIWNDKCSPSRFHPCYEVSFVSGKTVTISPNGEITAEQAVYNIQGSIVNKNDQPISGVNIQIGKEVITSNNDGRWEFPNLAEGDYVLNLSKAGYEPISQNIKVGEDQPTEIKLTLSSLIKMRTTSTAKKVGQSQHITFVIVVTNSGKQPAKGIVFSDVIPTGTQLLTIKADRGGKCEKKTVSCKLNNLAASRSVRIELVVQSKLKDQPLVNIAQVQTSNYPANFDKYILR